MFENLVESQVKRQRSWKQAIVSLVVHVAVIFGAVKATQSVAETLDNQSIDTIMTFLRPPEPTEPTKPASPPPSDAPMSENPPPKGFKTMPTLTDIPKDIPPVDLNEKPFDPKDYSGIGVEGGSATGVVGGTGPLDAGGGGGTGGSGGVYVMAELDDPVEPINIPEPRYPPALQSMSIAGRVELQYVVDTTGHAEPNSFKVLNSTHPSFIAPAKEAILKGVFKPAKFRGRPVRQLVQQAISFKVGQ